MSHENDESPSATPAEPRLPVLLEPLPAGETYPPPPGPMFTAGGRPGPGRPKGRANRATLVMRDALTAVFLDLQARHKGKGEYSHFYAWAHDNPTHFYQLAVRSLPLQIDTNGKAIGVVVFGGFGDEAGDGEAVERP